MINRQRIKERLEQIYRCGEQPDGTYSRIAFSKEDIRGRELFGSYLAQLGLNASLDKAGNLIARLEGSDAELPPIMVGSHLDTVPDGGKYDGVYGCVGALEIIENLCENREQLRHPLEVIVFADEEGICFGKGLLGSNAIAGVPLEGFSAEDLDQQGNTRKKVMGNYGVDYENISQAARDRAEVACFLEMHVEQGRALDKGESRIGIVTTIAGVSRFMIKVLGETNHSGSTMMADRKDALVGAALFISKIPKMIADIGSAYAVGTVGKLEVTPGSVNVIPGEVEFSLEIREQSDENRQTIVKELFSALETICQSMGLTFQKKEIANYACAPMDANVVDAFEKICMDKKVSYAKMPSGAFHDAMFMTRTFMTGMLFVPSVDGISHSPHEYTREEDLQTGCEVLYETVKYLDKHLN